MRRPLAVALLAGVVLLLAAPAASAHALLRSSDPTSGASLGKAPEKVTLTFTEPPDLTLSTVHVLDSTGRAVESGRAKGVPGKPLVLEVPLGQLPNGAYTVSWRTVSRADGHLTNGSFAVGARCGRAMGVRLGAHPARRGGGQQPAGLPPARGRPAPAPARRRARPRRRRAGGDDRGGALACRRGLRRPARLPDRQQADQPGRGAGGHRARAGRGGPLAAPPGAAGPAGGRCGGDHAGARRRGTRGGGGDPDPAERPRPVGSPAGGGGLGRRLPLVAARSPRRRRRR